MITYPEGDGTVFASMAGPRIVVRHAGPLNLPMNPPWSDAVWLRDSDHWVRVLLDYHGLKAVVRSLGHPRYRRTIALGMPPAARGGWDDPDLRPLGATDRTHVLGVAGARSVGPELLRFDVASSAKQLLPVRLPAHIDVMDVALSPDGKELAWLTYPERGTELVPLESIHLMISRADGTELRMIRSLAAIQGPRVRPLPSPSDDQPRYLRWTAGARAVEFAYGGKLWTIRLGL